MARIGVELPDDLAQQVSDKIPWGIRSSVMVKLLRAYLQAFDDQGPEIELVVRYGDFEITPTNKRTSSDG